MTDYKKSDFKREYNEKWNFKDGSMRELVHGLHPYPAMMMPLIARAMFEKYGKKSDTVFLDPYVGSGTALVEAQFYGAKKAIGIDLNPLAILISKVKTQENDVILLADEINLFNQTINDITKAQAPCFSIRDSWFNEKSITELSKIRYYIASITDKKVKDFFKVAFSEVVRSCSETRNGEFKLYRMTKQSLAKFNPEPIKTFKEILKRNFGIVKNASYSKNTSIELYNENTLNLSSHGDLTGNVDLIITSPPYGDSHTTVAYGQFSRLSNEWLGFEGAATLDKRLLGGKKVKDREFGIFELDDAIVKIKAKDKTFTRDRAWEVVAFYNDYEESIKAVANTVKSGGYIVYVVGNRRVRNIELPMDIITYKMFEKLGFKHITTHVRDILNKRMPSKASPSHAIGGQISTMMQEYIVIMKKK